MAIAAAIAITPPPAPLTIHTDSQSAVHMMQHVKAPLASRELYKSPVAFLWLHLRAWLQSPDAPVSVVWVRGYSGATGNERVYRLATSAHNDPPVTRWTIRMLPPPGLHCWILHDNRAVPRRPQRLLREQDEAITSEQLVRQVNAVPDRPEQSPEEVRLILKPL